MKDKSNLQTRRWVLRRVLSKAGLKMQQTSSLALKASTKYSLTSYGPADLLTNAWAVRLPLNLLSLDSCAAEHLPSEDRQTTGVVQHRVGRYQRYISQLLLCSQLIVEHMTTLHVLLYRCFATGR